MTQILDLENGLKLAQATQAKIEEKVAKEKKFFENERQKNDTLRAENKQQFNLLKKKDVEVTRLSSTDQGAPDITAGAVCSDGEDAWRVQEAGRQQDEPRH